jgi:hypothetical protein
LHRENCQILAIFENISRNKLLRTENPVKSPSHRALNIGNFGMNKITRIETIVAPQRNQSVIRDILMILECTRDIRDANEE